VSSPEDHHPELVRRVLSGDAQAIRSFHEELKGVIRSRILRVLFRPFAGRPAVWDPRREADDLTQEVFAKLFDPAASPLRLWSPTGGRSLPNYVGCQAERRAHDHVRVRKNRAPESLDDLLLDTSEPASVPGPEQRAITREIVERVVEAVHERLSRLWLEMFYLIFVDERDTSDICDIMGVSSDVVHKRRGRLRQAILAIFEEIMNDEGAGGERRKT
jgi:RNA polymerase sigma factor (sigma-70 family)